MIRFPKRNGKGINIMDKSMDRTVAWLALVLTVILTILSATTLHQAINAPIDPTKRMIHFEMCASHETRLALALGRASGISCPEYVADWHMGHLVVAGTFGIMALLSLGFTVRQFQRARPDALPRDGDEMIIARETSRLKTLKAQEALTEERRAREGR
jgi:hypothetical protein